MGESKLSCFDGSSRQHYDIPSNILVEADLAFRRLPAFDNTQASPGHTVSPTNTDHYKLGPQILLRQAAILEMVQVGGVTLNKWPPIPLACQETSTEQETTFIVPDDQPSQDTSMARIYFKQRAVANP